MSAYLIVGLGNPGQDYQLTRHNIGWMLVDYLAKDWSIQMQLRSKEKAWTGSGIVQGKKVWLCKPITYMNLSGDAVQPLMAYYDIPRENLLVLSDDVTLEFGRVRLRAKGSSGGQKGIQSIIQRLSSEDFARLRLGVGPFIQGRNLSAFVLERFPKDQQAQLDDVFYAMSKGIQSWLQEGTEAAVPLCNSFRLNRE